MSKIVKLKVARRTKPLDLDRLRIGPTAPTNPPTRQLRSRAIEPFIWVTVADLVRGANAVSGKQGLVVWLYLLHKAKMRLGDPILVANITLKKWGVSPDAKVRALRQLERAGLISIEWGGRCSPIVMVMK